MSCPQRKLNIELIGFTPEDLIAKLPNIEENIVFDMQRAINGLKI
jgi:hypothetical protein